VPVIQCCDLGEPQAFCDGDHGGIDHAKREIDIGLHELGHSPDILVLQLSDVKPSSPNDFRKVTSARGLTRD
jgi:hypothetical protein